MKKTLILIARPICRLISSALWQLVWLVPFWCVCWYAKLKLPQVIRAHFNVDQLVDRLSSLEKFAELMKNNTSLSNPGALMHYISAQFSRFSVSTKLNTVEMASNFLQTLCIWGLNLAWIVAVVYAVIRTIRAYRSRTEIFETATAVSNVLSPEFVQLKQEIAALREEIQNLKNQSPIMLGQAHSELLEKHE